MNSDVANIYRQIFIVPCFLSLEYIPRNEVPNFTRQFFVQSLEELPCRYLKLGTIFPSIPSSVSPPTIAAILLTMFAILADMKILLLNSEWHE